MTRDEIYDHLARVYLGKKNDSAKKKRKQFNAWLLINIVITAIIFLSSLYGLSAFLVHHGESFQNKVVYALSKGPIRVSYDLKYPYPPVKTFTLSTEMDAQRYKTLEFRIRGLEGGYPGVVRIEVRNTKNETSSTMIEDVNFGWKKFSIPFEKLNQISDWSEISGVSFILESWNVEKKKGAILIDDICFSS